MVTNPRPDTFFPQSDWPRSGKRMAVEAYHELERLSPDRKYEYIDGVAYMMSGGSIEHDRIRRNIENALDNACGAGPCTVYGPDVQVSVGLKKSGRPHYLYPDTTISCDAADHERGTTLIASPHVIVEVLSPSTETKDRVTKFRAYQEQETVQEIVLINQFAPYVEIWQRNEHTPLDTKTWLYRHYGPGESIEIMSINAHIEMATIYRGIAFDDEMVEETM
jgi:Uma2 family endonuclease